MDWTLTRRPPATSSVAAPAGRVAALSLRQLIPAFLWIGGVPTGGRTLALFFDEIVRRRGWLSREEFVEGQALAQLLPGPTGAYITLYIVQLLRGSADAFVCVLAFVLPGAAIMLALSTLFADPQLPAWLAGALHGLGCAAVGLLFATTLRMVPSVRGARLGPVVCALAFLAHGLLGLDLLPVLVSLGITSLVINRRQRDGEGDG